MEYDASKLFDDNAEVILRVTMEERDAVLDFIQAGLDLWAIPDPMETDPHTLGMVRGAQIALGACLSAIEGGVHTLTADGPDAVAYVAELARKAAEEWGDL